MRTALITGANSGLGLATALRLAAADTGLKVVGTVRSPDKAALVEAAAEKAGVRVATRILDITDEAACKEVVGEVRPDVLVNNAGGHNYAPVMEVSEQEARHHMETGVFAPIRLARMAVPHMEERGWGRVVQISSIAGRINYPMMGWYQAGKHALEAVSDALRIELAGTGVDVVTIASGGFHSGLTEDMAEATAHYKETKWAVPFKRLELGFDIMEKLWSDIGDVADTVAVAATAESPRPRYVVGKDAHLTLIVDGLVENLGHAVPPIPVSSLKDFVMRKLLGLP